MALYQVWSDFCVKIDSASDQFLSFCVDQPSSFSPSNLPLRSEFFLEGLLSYAWQAWGDFCRECIIESCIGTATGTGALVAAHPSAISPDHVSGAALRAKRATNNPPYWGNVNTMLRLEPTWGDTQMLAALVPRLGPSNQTQLQAAFSSAHSSAKLLQTIRNATAHRNGQTHAEVVSLASGYSAFAINSPLSALFWTVPSSNEYVAIHLFEDLRDNAMSCIS